MVLAGTYALVVFCSLCGAGHAAEAPPSRALEAIFQQCVKANGTEYFDFRQKLLADPEAGKYVAEIGHSASRPCEARLLAGALAVQLKNPKEYTRTERDLALMALRGYAMGL